MIAEIAAINAAMAVIKTTIAHGKDIASAGSAISKLINGEEELRERANQKKNSVFSKLLGIEHLVLAVNKTGLLGFSEDWSTAIYDKYSAT